MFGELLFGPADNIKFHNSDRQKLLDLYGIIDSELNPAGWSQQGNQPLMECDYYFKVEGNVTENLFTMPEGLEWAIWSTNTDFQPTSIGWEYSKDAIGFPIPNVSSNRCTVSLAQSRRDVPGALSMSRYLRDLYNLQFSKDGLLALPNSLTMHIEVGASFTVQQMPTTSAPSGISVVQYPIYRFENVRIATPRIKFNSSSTEPAMWSFDFVYKNSQTSVPGNYATINSEHVFPKVDAIPEAEYHEAQFGGRTTSNESK